MAERKGKSVLHGAEFKASIERLVQGIFEDRAQDREIAIVGIARGGIPLANRIAAACRASGRPVVEGVLDITFYRDDVSLREAQPVIRATEIPFSLDEKYVVLVDDVLYSGRTIRSAMDALVDFGRPEIIRLAVMVDRGHRELPIHADFVGMTLTTKRSENVVVCWTENGAERDEVIVQDREKSP